MFASYICCLWYSLLLIDIFKKKKKKETWRQMQNKSVSRPTRGEPGDCFNVDHREEQRKGINGSEAAFRQ